MLSLLLFLKEDDLLGAKSDVGPDKYRAWRQLISDLVERDALMQQTKSVALQPEESSRLEVLPKPAGMNSWIGLIRSPPRCQYY